MVDKIDNLLDGRADHWLESRAKLPKNKINKIRTGKQYMRADEMWRISKALNVPVEWLLNDQMKASELITSTSIDVPAAHNIVDMDVVEGRGNGSHKPEVRKPKHRPSGK